MTTPTLTPGPDGRPVFVCGSRRIDDRAGIRALRRAYGWSVADLAARAGMSKRTVENWEQGRRPSTDALLRLMLSL